VDRIAVWRDRQLAGRPHSILRGHKKNSSTRRERASVTRSRTAASGPAGNRRFALELKGIKPFAKELADPERETEGH